MATDLATANRLWFQRYPTRTLVKWWHELNRWGWPDTIARKRCEPISRNFPRRQIMREIAEVVGKRAILKSEVPRG